MAAAVHAAHWFNARVHDGCLHAQLRNMGFPLTWSLCDEVVYNDPRFQVTMHAVLHRCC